MAAYVHSEILACLEHLKAVLYSCGDPKASVTDEVDPGSVCALCRSPAEYTVFTMHEPLTTPS